MVMVDAFDEVQKGHCSILLSNRDCGWVCSSVGKASDRHAVNAGSIARCGKGFFSKRKNFNTDSLTVSSPLPPPPPRKAQ